MKEPQKPALSSIGIELVIEGDAVASGTIDAQMLAASLIGYSAIFKRVNAIVNGEASDAAVLVDSEFKPGSFITGLQLVQQVSEQARTLITSHEFLTAGSLAALIGFIAKNKDSLIELWKWLKGNKPDKTVSIGNTTEITFGSVTKVFSSPVYYCYGDATVRAAFGQAVTPLHQQGIERIAIKQNDSEQVAIEKLEADYFHPEPLQLEPDNTPTEGERDTVLIVSKLSFVEGTTWTFFEQGASLTAKIEDGEFWQNVHEHKVTFGEGDRLRVRLQWKVEKNRSGRLVAKNTINKVYEQPTTPLQMLLASTQGDNQNY